MVFRKNTIVHTLIYPAPYLVDVEDERGRERARPRGAEILAQGRLNMERPLWPRSPPDES